MQNREMHELSITHSILATVLEKADATGAGHIRQVNVVIGKLSGFADDSIQLYFEALSKETIAAGAKLSFRQSPAQFRCHGCSVVFPSQNGDWSCPECRGQSVEVVSGQEVYVEGIEVD